MSDLTPAQAVLARAMTEEQLEANVAGLCKTLRAKRAHTWNSRHSPAGWPDDVIGGPGGVIFRELKRETGKPSPDQREWLAILTAAGFDADLWYPRDWFSGRIEREVRAVAGRR